MLGIFGMENVKSLVLPRTNRVFHSRLNNGILNMLNVTLYGTNDYSLYAMTNSISLRQERPTKKQFEVMEHGTN